MIKPSGGMMCQGVRKEIKTKGVIGNPIHFDTLGDMQEFVKMLVSIVTQKFMKLERVLNLLNHVILESKIHCLNSNRGNWSTPTIQSWLAQLLHSSEVENNSYEAPGDVTTTGSASDGTGKKKGRTVTLTTDDMQKRKNNVKARTTLLLSLPDEYQLRFSKYKTAQELWTAILKTFGGNEATKKTKKNLLKHQYGNFKAEGSETLEQTFNRLLAPEWFMHTIVWRNKSDLDTMSLDDLYNHLKVYESEVQKKSKPNSQNIAFISSAKHNSGNEEVNIASSSTASINVSTASANIRIDENDIEEMDIKWNMALLSMRADRFWKKTVKKISIQGTDVAGFDKSKFLLDFSSSAIFTAVASLFYWQWELSSLALGTSSDSGNSITGSGNASCILFPTILP
nr:hypothetical protein [Tanacetum cinerariifolium]